MTHVGCSDRPGWRRGEDKPSHSANAKTGRLSDLNLTQSELECIQVLLKYLTLLHIAFRLLALTGSPSWKPARSWRLESISRWYASPAVTWCCFVGDYFEAAVSVIAVGFCCYCGNRGERQVCSCSQPDTGQWSIDHTHNKHVFYKKKKCQQSSC